jgi:hypothetical protein
MGRARPAVIEGDVETGSVVARQSVGMATQVQPVAAILEDRVGPAVGALAARITWPIPAVSGQAVSKASSTASGCFSMTRR